MSAATSTPSLDDVAVVIASRQGRIEFWSEGATSLFGYNRGAILGRLVTVLIPPEFHARHWAGWGRAWRLNTVPASPPIWIPVVCADGVVRHFISHLEPIHAPHGALVAVAAVWSPPSTLDTEVRVLT